MFSLTFSLNLDSLNLPHADDSDASEKENEDQGVLADADRNGMADRIRTVRPSGYVCSLSTKSSVPPPPPPPPPSMKSLPKTSHLVSKKPENYRDLAGKALSVDQGDGYETEIRLNNHSRPISGPWEPLETVSCLI